MATTYYVHWDDGDDGTGDGSSGSPWATLAYAVTQVSDGDSIEVDTTSTLSEDSGSAGLSVATDNITIYPASGWGPTSLGPQLSLTSDSRYPPCVNLSGAGCVIDGFDLQNGRNQSPGDCIRMPGGSCTFKNGTITAAHDNALELGGDDDIVENVLITAGNFGIMIAGGYSHNHIVRNCVVAGIGTGVGCDYSTSDGDIYSTLFFECTNDCDSGAESYWTGDYNATTKGTAESFGGSNWVEGIDNTSSSSNTDVEDPSADDYRAKSGGALEDAGDTTYSASADMFGTSRDANPDIGYYEIPASGGTITGSLGLSSTVGSSISLDGVTTINGSLALTSAIGSTIAIGGYLMPQGTLTLASAVAASYDFNGLTEIYGALTLASAISSTPAFAGHVEPEGALTLSTAVGSVIALSGDVTSFGTLTLATSIGGAYAISGDVADVAQLDLATAIGASYALTGVVGSDTVGALTLGSAIGSAIAFSGITEVSGALTLASGISATYAINGEHLSNAEGDLTLASAIASTIAFSGNVDIAGPLTLATAVSANIALVGEVAIETVIGDLTLTSTIGSAFAVAGDVENIEGDLTLASAVAADYAISATAFAPGGGDVFGGKYIRATRGQRGYRGTGRP